MNDARDESARGKAPPLALQGLPETERTLLIVDDDVPLCQRRPKPAQQRSSSAIGEQRAAPLAFACIQSKQLRVKLIG